MYSMQFKNCVFLELVPSKLSVKRFFCSPLCPVHKSKQIFAEGNPKSENAVTWQMILPLLCTVVCNYDV